MPPEKSGAPPSPGGAPRAATGRRMAARRHRPGSGKLSGSGAFQFRQRGPGQARQKLPDQRAAGRPLPTGRKEPAGQIGMAQHHPPPAVHDQYPQDRRLQRRKHGFAAQAMFDGDEGAMQLRAGGIQIGRAEARSQPGRNVRRAGRKAKQIVAPRRHRPRAHRHIGGQFDIAVGTLRNPARGISAIGDQQVPDRRRLDRLRINARRDLCSLRVALHRLRRVTCQRTSP